MKSVIQSVVLIGHTLPFPCKEKYRGVGTFGELPNVTALCPAYSQHIFLNPKVNAPWIFDDNTECSCRIVRIR